MIQKSSIIKMLLVIGFILLTENSYAQQDPQYTHYMYNTLTVNPAYAGQRETFSMVGLYRSQWAGIEGAPQTQSLGVHSPLRNERLGLGLTVVSDELGPSREIFANANFSYTIPLNIHDLKLSFGVKAGMHQLDTDWSKGRFQNPDAVFNENVNLLSPTIGAGLYIHTDRWYLGFTIPSVLNTKHYDDFQESIATERLHYYLIGGYVFNLNRTTQFKPAFLIKGVSGSPLIADVSANFLFKKKLTLGIAWRWDDAFSALAGIQLSNTIFVGYGYDLTTTALNNYNSGTHEITLRFEVKKVGRMISPRFF